MNTEKIMEDIQSVQDNIREIKSTWGNTIMTLDNIKSGLKADVQKKVDEAYQRGLEDAWEAAWLIFNMSDEDAMEAGLDTEFNLSASEAIAKLKAYEDKQKAEEQIKVKVGDEVEVLKTGSKYLIAWISGSTLCGFSYAGIICRLQPSEVRKTGRHFDIEGILEAMRT